MDTADGNIYIYTDASAPRRTGKWGIGVYFGLNPDLADLTQHRELDGRKNSGEAEVFAATEALRILWESEKYLHESGPLVVLRTDCQTMVLRMKRIIAGGTVRQPSEGKTFDNVVRALIQLAEKFPQGVRFEHVYAGSTDEGIQAADRLATRASYGLTAERRGHDHSRSRRIASRPSRNFFHPTSMRVNENCHVKFSSYARLDEMNALMESFRVSEPTQETETNATDDSERSSSESPPLPVSASPSRRGKRRSCSPDGCGESEKNEDDEGPPPKKPKLDPTARGFFSFVVDKCRHIRQELVRLFH
ncbi:CRE-RNH-1.1 protein [Aphelenchoides avenae]|nr:CRE-RNH-1.1 protein [Aphelenchus avenae]